MPVEGRYSDRLVQPVNVLLVVQGIDDAGKLNYWTMLSPGLDSMTARGMAHWLLTDISRRRRL